MDSDLYGAHPDEKEILLMEGIDMAVLGIDELEIDNQLTGDSIWDDFNMQTVTVVYLFHTNHNE